MINSESGLTFARRVREDGDGLLNAAGGEAQLTGVRVCLPVRSADLSRVVQSLTQLLTHALRLSPLLTALGTELTHQVRTRFGNGARDRFCDPEGDG